MTTMGLQILDVTDATRLSFRLLWAEFLAEHEKLGSDTKATNRSLAAYDDLVTAYIRRQLPGVALLARMDGRFVGALLWGSSGPIPLDRVNESVVAGWGSYTQPDYRRHGVSDALRREAALRLHEMGIETVYGSAVLSNVAGVEASRKIGFRPTMIVGELEVSACAQGLTDGFYWEGHCPLCGRD